LTKIALRRNTMRMYAIFLTLLFMFTFLPAIVQADTVFIEAGGDNTLFENPDGALSNGSGPVFFAGRNNLQTNSILRGVIYFDVNAELPANAKVESVFLTLYSTRATNGDRMVRLHRLIEDWGEGGSSSGGGTGAPAESGDATWLHTFYLDSYWSKEGGQYVGRVSASQVVANANGYYTWGSTARLVHDIDYWMRHPEKNFGWIIIGDESASQTGKRFASRENPDPALVPVLEINYSVPTE
jgi:hypothetical protein